MKKMFYFINVLLLSISFGYSAEIPSSPFLYQPSVYRNEVRLNWSTITNAEYYNIQWRELINNYWEYPRTAYNNSYVFYGSYGRTYDFRVRACNYLGCSAYSNTVRVTIPYNTAPSISGLPNVEIRGPTYNLRKLIDFRHYAYDTETTVNNLRFYIINQTNTNIVKCYIEDSYYLSCYEPYTEGYSNITIRVLDEQGSYDEDTFSVIVRNIERNTKPIISTLPSVVIRENSGYSSRLIDLWNYTYDAEDSDYELDFSIINQTNSKLINCKIVSNRWFECEAPTANKTGKNYVTVRVEDTEGYYDEEDVEVTVYEEYSPNCSDLYIEDYYLELEENTTEDIKIRIENNSEQRFYLDNVSISESSAYINFIERRYDSTIAADGYGYIYGEIRSYGVSYDRYVDTTVEVEGHFSNGKTCELRKNIRIKILDNYEEPSPFCSDISIRAYNIEVSENNTIDRRIYLKNQSNKRFYIESLYLEDNSNKLNVYKISSPSTVGPYGEEAVDIRLTTSEVYVDETAKVKIYVRGYFSNGRQCSGSEINSEFSVYIKNTPPSSIEPQIELIIDTPYITLTKPSNIEISFSVKNNSEYTKCVSLELETNSNYVEAVTQTKNFCIDPKSIRSGYISINAKNEGSYAVRAKLKYDNSEIMRTITINVNKGEQIEKEGKLEIINYSSRVVLEKNNSVDVLVSLYNESNKDIENVVITIENLPNTMYANPVIRERIIGNATAATKINIEDKGTPEGNYKGLLTIKYDDETLIKQIEIEVKSTVETGTTGLLTLSNSITIALIVVIIILVVAILVALVSRK